MYICVSYTTDHSYAPYIPASIVAKGDTLDELIEGISDELADCFGSDPDHVIEGVEDHNGNPIEDNIMSVCEAIHGGTECIVAKCKGFKNVYTICQTE